MRSIAICGPKVWEKQPHNPSLGTLEMDGVTVTCGCLDGPAPVFQRQAPEQAQQVLLKIRAFSCNYRDKALMFRMATRQEVEYAYYAIGSEFVAEVLEVGVEVHTVQVGDRVMVNGSYPVADVPGVPGGLPTNQASQEYQILHHAKVLAIPATMPDDVAAAFSIGAQTIFSMLRKLAIPPGARVLVTAAKSNTSLFAINALKHADVTLYATSTSSRGADALQHMGVHELAVVDPASPSWLDYAPLRQVVDTYGGFDYVIDPFYDLHLGKVIALMKPGGTYITCGFYDQYLAMLGKSFQSTGASFARVMSDVMLKNVQLIGNCLGVTADLRRALEAYTAGTFQVVLDSVYSGPQVQDFLHRTYNASERLGKVVYRYT